MILRRGLAALMMTVLLLLCGCKGAESSMDTAIDFRAKLVQAGGCSFRAKMTADFGSYVERFTVDCTAKTDGTATVTLVEPECLEGITAIITGDSGTVTYEGLNVDFGVLAQGNVIPAAAPSILVACWAKEYMSATGEENGLYHVSYEKDFEQKRLNVDTYFKNGLPISAEVCYNNQKILQIEIIDFQLDG